MIARRTRNGRPQYLTKWRGLGYSESTWETERALAQEQVRPNGSLETPAAWRAGPERRC